ncbi:hypothetical protein [Serpentinimonas maccroryi]|uniref:hypothetical protein n=1 Tax=Serpentinimonas maccroryi TaxID=1458426 RepID=UPI0020347040|nr:hypothetical protein [Serpentinimonas maccroryi]MCM2479196.1 hypothetical protein [Serpentinimonas maccroryi]
MSLSTRIETLVIRVAQEFKDVRAKAGNLANLATTDKTSLVAAINELRAAVAAATAIDDGRVSATTTYSSNQIVALLNALKTEILGGADAAYDTLLEIQQLLQSGTSGLDALLAAVNHRVRFDAVQTLELAQQQQARANIGAASAVQVDALQTEFTGLAGAVTANVASVTALQASVGNTQTDFVAVFEGALV